MWEFGSDSLGNLLHFCFLVILYNRYSLEFQYVTYNRGMNLGRIYVGGGGFMGLPFIFVSAGIWMLVIFKGRPYLFGDI